MQSHKPTQLRLDLTSDLQKWRAFLAIAELGSLTRAALFLDSNQSLLSRHLNALERECKARLFNRTGRGVALSDVGQRIFPLVKALLSDAEQLEAEILGEAREPAGRVTIGSLPSITNPMVGRLFKQLREKHPAVQLKVLEGSSGQVEEWLADARVDIAILYRYGSAPPESEQALATVDSYLIGAAGDRLTAAEEVPFSALHELPFILPGVPNGLRTALDAMARHERITLAPVIEADSLPLMRSTVAEARLYTVLPIHAVWSEVKEGKLQAARIASPTLERIVSMALARSKGPSRAVAAVAAEIVQIVEDSARSGMWRSGTAATGGLPPAAYQP
ncbi:LysR substrate-binding domain-containing protein [Pseudorhodoferax soli]|uniref:DNA-binding transcriptional LysR family regulator n=1 Tax=Pseudorhodoferax soli TaxID=545864 RepID=A0A368XRG7_9BURK|nr:LysR substrate-binding domain-containing protein [Pseudorhodoferax soli]RCW70542.1 DNA-binding transcriptional LysR family regulator [Pseudorhodoferax soli]